MIGQAINDFRVANGARPVSHWERPVDDYCVAHSKAMADRGDLYHSPDCCRPGMGEVVGASAMLSSFRDTARHIIFKLIGESTDGHREMLLGWSTVAYGCHVRDGMVYLTIRGN